MANDDTVPQKYKYAWTPDSADEIALSEFINKYKPSMVQNTDGSKPWIWVKRIESPREDGQDAAVEEATTILEELTARVEEIKNDADIPARSSKKTGAKGKKEVREEAQAEATEKLKEIAIEHGFVSGKWLAFAPADKVDAIWSSLATSIVEGPLSETAAFGAKVATSSADGSSSQHLICVYVPDVYDKAAVTEVMKVLLKSHGLTLSGVKSNLYTLVGIDSKHPSGIQSTTWKNAAILPDSEIKALKEAFFEGLSAAKVEATAKATEAAKKAKDAKANAKPQLKKKKAEEDDPFASGDSEEDDDGEAQRKAELQAKKKKVAPKKRAKADSEDEDEEDEPPKKKKSAKK